MFGDLIKVCPLQLRSFVQCQKLQYYILLNIQDFHTKYYLDLVEILIAGDSETLYFFQHQTNYIPKDSVYYFRGYGHKDMQDCPLHEYENISDHLMDYITSLILSV